MTDTIAQPRVEPKRDRWGRYLIPVNGKAKPYTRATTFAGTIDDRYNLELWKTRMVAVGLTARPDLYAQVAANHDDKQKLNRLAAAAVEAAKGSAGANLGTALHTFTERIDLGETVHVPAPWDADVAAYTAAMQQAGVHTSPEFIERIVVLHDLEVAGTFDRLVTIDNRVKPLIADLKTGAGLDFSWGSIAIQLALYAHADEFYDPVTDTTTPMVDVDLDQALVMHLPAGQATCSLYLVDIAAGWEAAQLCASVRGWRKRKGLNTPLATASIDTPTAPDTTTTPTPALGEDRRAYLRARIGLLRDNHPGALDELAASWPMGVPTFRDSASHTAEQLEQIANAIHAVEAHHAAPFGDDPATNTLPAEDLDRYVGRLKRLPADIAAQIAADLDGQVPHLRSGRFNHTHAAILEPRLLAGEEEAAQRFGSAEQALAAITDGDAAFGAAVIAACATDRYTWTLDQLAILAAIGRGIDTCTLALADTADGTFVLAAVGDGEKRLIATHGRRDNALTVCKQLAEAHGLERPRLLSDAVANPALYALAVSSAPSSDSQESAA